MNRIIDPWGTELYKDYEKLIKEFGLEIFNKRLFPEPNRLMRRGIVFAGRDLKRISDCIKNKKEYYVLTGIMPSGEKLHFGNKSVIENVKYFQDHGAKTYVLIADLEALATRGISLEEARKRAFDFHIPAYIALGLDIKKTIFYFQSQNKEVIHHSYLFSKKVTLNEFKAIYGNASPSRIMAATTQIADILFPQFKKRIPGIIPVGIDQDPHMRLTRDVVSRTKKMGFIMPSSIYHKFTPSLDGSIKMSKSSPESMIELPDDPKKTCKKLSNAFTGGRNTLKEQKKLGGIPQKCIIFELYKQHLIEDDKELNKIFNECKSGKLMCGECKQMACSLITKFMNDFEKKIEKARKDIDKIKIIEW